VRKKRRVGFVGCPPESVLSEYRKDELIDLDNHLAGIRRPSQRMLPATTCAIVKRIFDNAVALKPEVIVFDQGYGKCDPARMIAILLKEAFDFELITTSNMNTEGRGTPLCDAALPLRQKVDTILDDLIDPRRRDIQEEPSPKAGIWGVPASDFSLYDLFPRGTKIFGWLRCLENRTPADLDLECLVDDGLPVVFFSQAFCHKNILAKHLAKKYNGLYFDLEEKVSGTIKAKVEAFLRFRGAL
jgi:hypothetical protein